MYNVFLGEMNREQILQQMIEVRLTRPDSFLIIKETLTRMGIPSTNGNKLFQSCHIFHKKGKFYIVHFKEMLAMDGLNVTMSNEDVARRNAITVQLQEWRLLTIVDGDKISHGEIDLFILPHEDKKNWLLVPKYSMGKKIVKGDS